MDETRDVAELQGIIELGAAVKRLKESADFKTIFQDILIEAFAVTTATNFGYFSADARRGSVEQMLARGIFSKFMDDLEYDSANAAEELVSMEETANLDTHISDGVN